MRRVLIYPVLCLSLAAGAACSRDDRGAASVSDQATAQQPANRGEADDEQVEVTGCLTSNAETSQFVLTANANALSSMTSRSAATGEAETFHYQLVGGTDLASHVGREVIVKGTIKGDGKDVEMESEDKTQQQPTTKSGGEEVTPAVESSQEIELQVERLQVASVTPTGSACQIGQGQRR